MSNACSLRLFRSLIMVKPVTMVRVVSDLPPSLERLQELAYNLRWSWDHETISLFRRLDRDLWDESGHNPVLMLGSVSQPRLDEAARDESFLAHMDRVTTDLRDYMTGRGTWHARRF